MATESDFLGREISTKLRYANQSDQLYRRHFIMVLLGRADVDGIEEALRKQERRFRMEGRVDGQSRFADLA